MTHQQVGHLTADKITGGLVSLGPDAPHFSTTAKDASKTGVLASRAAMRTEGRKLCRSCALAVK